MSLEEFKVPLQGDLGGRGQSSSNLFNLCADRRYDMIRFQRNFVIGKPQHLQTNSSNSIVLLLSYSTAAAPGCTLPSTSITSLSWWQ